MIATLRSTSCRRPARSAAPWTRAGVLGLLLIVSACGAGTPGSEGAVVVVDTVDGVVTVRNDRRGVWSEGEEWTVQEAFRIGGTLEGPPEELFGSRSMATALGPHGHVYVLDQQAGEVRVFDRGGRIVRRIGRPGPGPGEFRSPASLAFDGYGRLWVANAFDGRFSIFDTAGTFIRTAPRAIHVLARLPYPLVFEESGTFVDEGMSSSRVVLLRVDTTGAVLDTLPPIQQPEGMRSNRFPIPGDFDMEALRYLRNVEWAVAPNGTLWIADLGGGRMVQRSLAGDTLRVVENRHRDEAIDANTRGWLEREFAKLDVDASSLDLVRPVVSALHILPDGHVLAHIGDESDPNGSALDVFDAEGRFLGTLELGFRMSSTAIPDLAGDTIVTVGVGEYDVPFVVRATIRRGER